MQVITTIGPENTTKTVLPFIAAKGAVSQGQDVDMFLMQEATYLGSPFHSDLSELKAPGLPTVGDVFEALLESGHLNDVVICKPCAQVRGLSAGDLRDFATFGGAGDLATQARRNDSTVTF